MKFLLSSIFFLPSSIFFLPSSIFYLPSSIFYLPSSFFFLTTQSPPNPISPREPPQPPAPILPSPQPNPLEAPPPASPPTVPIPETPQTITVERFEFAGNTAFSDAELAAVTQSFVGKPITFAQLLEVEAVITAKYTEAGYINSGAVIPANQTFNISSAIVKIQIVEGSVAEIRVSGTRRLRPGYVRSRLELASKRPFNRNRLLEALQLLQLDPLIKNISAELQAGVRPEASVLQVQVSEADSFNTEVSSDNERSPSIGSFRQRLRITEANLTGFGDAFETFYAKTEGSNEYGFNYTLPINPRNGSIALGASYTDTQVIEPPFSRIDITGESLALDFTYRQPIYIQPSQEFALGLSFSHQQSQTFVQGEEFALSLGADDRGRTKISAVRFFQDYVNRSTKQVFAARSQFSLGLGILDATINDKEPDSRFFAWRFQSQYIRLLAPETLLIIRGDVQLTPTSLVSLEQFGVGGVRSVRGYRQDTLLTDNGVFVSAEARFPILRVQEVRGLLQVVPFIDFGVGWNHQRQAGLQTQNTLLGAGAGLLWQMGDNFSARLDYGIPLINVDSGDRTWQERGVYFSIRYSP